jgi:predicted NAD/FAD-binding protein
MKKPKKKLTPEEWLKEHFFEQDRPKDFITPMVMEQYAKYILDYEKKLNIFIAMFIMYILQ